MTLTRSLGCWLGLVLIGCGSGQPIELTAQARPKTDGPGRVLPTGDHVPWRYDVRAIGDGASELAIEAVLRGVDDRHLRVDRGSGDFVEDVEQWSAGRWTTVDDSGDGFRLAPCGGECRIRYRYRLADAANALEDIEVAAARAGALLSPPSAWLLRPRTDEHIDFRFRVATAPGLSFESGIWPVDGEPRTYESTAAYLYRSPYSAFGRFRTVRLESGGGAIDVAIAQDAPPLDEPATLAWLQTAADTVSTYYGRFPVERALVLVLPHGGAGVGGSQMGGGGAAVVLRVGRRSGETALARDWVATHELIHIAVPSLGRRHLWLSEGIASYVEPLARAQRGLISPERVWGELLDGIPKGLPRAGDRGLDSTPTWGRTYWGGALYCLLADVELRRETGGRHSLQTALRGALADGAHTGDFWAIRRYLQAADRTTGTHVMERLYDRMRADPYPVDLDDLWSELGVTVRGDRIAFDDGAPLAEIRAAMTEPLGAVSSQRTLR